MFSVSTWNYLKAFGKETVLRENLAEIKKLGFGAELWLDWFPDPDFFRRSNWDYVKQLCSGFPNLSAHSGVKGKFSMKKLLEEMDLCAYIGADPLVCHPQTFGLDTGTWDFNSKLTLTNKNKELLHRILSEASERSLRLALENGSSDILLQVMGAIYKHPGFNNFGICIDTGHANIHQNRINEPVTEILELMKHNIIHLHMHDNDGMKDDHQVPGDGSTKWQGVFNELNKSGYNGEIVFELKSDNPLTASERARSIVRKKYPKSMKLQGDI